MAIHFAKEPANGVSLVQQGMKRLAARADHPLALAAASQTLQVEQPHAVYDLHAEDVAKGGGLASAVLSGFRYLVQADGKSVAVGEVQTDSAGTAKVLANINYGPFVQATVDALPKLQALPAVSSGPYELRMLRFSAAYLVALWLKPDTGHADILYPLAPAPAGLEANRAYTEADLFQVIRPLAQKRAESKAPSLP